MNPSEYFEQLSHTTADIISRLKKKIRSISLLRLAVFLCTVGTVYFLWSNAYSVTISIVLGVAIFLLLVRWTIDLKSDLKIEEGVLSNCNEELAILKGNWQGRFDGATFPEMEHPYANDLNVFGRHSLFQYLNRCKTPLATEQFAEMLKNEMLDPTEIGAEQQFIRELSTLPEFLMRFLSHAGFTHTSQKLIDRIKRWSSAGEVSRSAVYWIFLTWILPLFSLAALLAYATDFISSRSYILCLVCVGVTLMVNIKSRQKQFSELSEMLSETEGMEAMLSLIGKQEWTSQKALKLIDGAALNRSSEGIAKLKKLVNAIENRNNILISLALNLLLLWDFQCMKRLMVWKREYGHMLPQWFELAHTFESYCSFGLFVFDHPDFIYPVFLDKNDFEIRGGRHVLMNEKAVDNDLDLTGEMRFSIITGANMAGKSTYLRMVGTNMLLAMRGLPVPVRSFNFRPTKIFTSMLSADSLGDNESYFFNELKRLRQMADILETGSARFVILDEILKGTNSIDKAEGARRFMQKLLKLPAHGLIATHDLSLCKLSKDYPLEIENTKFEVRFERDELAFDYKLETGICQNMNASFLLQKMGLSD